MRLLSISVIVLAGMIGMGLGASAGTHNAGGYTAFNFGFGLAIVGIILFVTGYLMLSANGIAKAASGFAEYMNRLIAMGLDPESVTNKPKKSEQAE